jgi:hypothetical protein
VTKQTQYTKPVFKENDTNINSSTDKSSIVNNNNNNNNNTNDENNEVSNWFHSQLSKLI